MKRYQVFGKAKMVEKSDGRWMLVAEHEEIIAALREGSVNVEVEDVAVEVPGA